MFSAFNPSKCKHTWSSGQPTAVPGEQSWTSCRSRDSNPQPWVTSGFKSNALSIRPTTALTPTCHHLTPMERARRINLGLCMYCGAHDHLLPVCPIRPTRPAVSTVQILPDVSKLPHIDALLIHMNQSFPAKVLVDSGASGNFISSLFLIQINVPRHRNATHYQITNIQGKPLGKGLVRSRTPEVTLRIGSLHSEYISFLVLEDATVDIVLAGTPLARFTPS